MKIRSSSRTRFRLLRRRLSLAVPILCALWLFSGAACSHLPPADVENICAIFSDRSNWYKAAQKSEARWGTPKHVQMAIMRQESSFVFNAKPPRTELLGFIPWKRPSNAYGYAQALDSTWRWYLEDTGRRSANRDDFDDAIDFVGWYTDKSQRLAGISKWDPYNQYLAYHEGQGGWSRGSYREKAWLKERASRVDRRARNWWAQLQQCEDDLGRGWWFFGG